MYAIRSYYAFAYIDYSCGFCTASESSGNEVYIVNFNNEKVGIYPGKSSAYYYIRCVKD